MGNLCSIFHVRFKHLMRVIPSARKAQLLDYILLGWQTSTYKLKGSEHKWFMKPYAQIVEETGIPKSTLERYIKELYEEGFIERRQALYSRIKEQGGFEVKKGTYIHITDKLLALIKPSQPDSVTLQKDDQNDSYQDHNIIKDNIKPDCINTDINEGIDPLKMRGLYISDLYKSSSINIITLKKLISSVDTSTLQRLKGQFETIQTMIYSEIKEEIPDEIKKLVLGTFFNISFEHHKQFSSPKQLVAEYLFALLNIEFYLPQVTCFKHRNNILSKIIRSNRWRTPKGFYNYFYLGQNFKHKQDFREKQYHRQKNMEIKQAYNINDDQKDNRLIQLENEMIEKSTFIEKLTHSLHQSYSEEEITMIRDQIRDVKYELEHLWHQQILLEQEIEQEREQHVLNKEKKCA